MDNTTGRDDRKTITIHIVPSNKTTIKKIINHQFQDTRFYWMYLGTDVPFDLSLRNQIDQKGHRISIAPDIQSTAQKSRKDYIRFIGDLMPDDDLQSWWLSNISEKNPFTVNLFLQFCYINACLNHVQDCDRDLLVICQTRGLAGALAKNLGMRGVIVKTYDTFGLKLWNILSSFFAGIFRLGWFGLNYSARSLLAKGFSWLKKDRKLLFKYPDEWICLHSWTDKRSFGTHGFADIYFGDLGNTLIHKGYPVFFLVDVLPTFSYFQALKNLFQTEKKIILFEEFISPVDVVASIFSVREPVLRKEPVSIKGVDVSFLIGELQRKSAYDPRTRWAQLCYRVAKKISQYSPPSRFICTFENHIWEKMFSMGFHESSDKTKVMGYAHTIVNTMYTNYTISKKEEKLAPLPDRIIVNGTRTAKILAASGFDPATIAIGGSLRYSHLTKTGDRPPHHEGEKTVLLTASAELNESLELIYSALQTFGGIDHITVIIKCHPTVPFSHVAGLLPRLPKNFQVSEESVENLLLKADLVLYTSSASAVEAFAIGVPVIHVKSEYRIDMNIFEGFTEVPSATTSQLSDLYHLFTSADITDKSTDDKEKREKIIRDLFTPVDENSYRLFVKD